MTEPELGQYCRAIETHLCQVNHGHLIRIVGPAFDLVRRWHAEAVPLKIVLRGIERRAARVSRAASASRRPLRVEFCEADVMDVFDEWRRAIGFALSAAAPMESSGNVAYESAGETPSSGEEPHSTSQESAPSLPKHLERVSLRLTSFLASSSGTPPALHARVAAVLDAVEQLRAAGRVRGDARRAALERLAMLDEELLAAVMTDAPDGWLDEARAEAHGDLSSYAGRMPAAEFARMVDRTALRLLRARLQLPDVRLS